MPSGWTVTCKGVGGRDITQQTIDAPAAVDPLYDPALGQNILATWEFVNQYLHYGSTGDEAYALMRSYCLARRAAGWRVIVCTELPCCCNAGYYPATWSSTPSCGSTGRVRRRPLPISPPTRASATRETSLTDRLGIAPAPRRLTGVHLGDAGYAIVAEAMESTLTSLCTLHLDRPALSGRLRVSGSLEESSGTAVKVALYLRVQGAWRILRRIAAARTGASTYAGAFTVRRKGVYKVPG